MKTLEIVKVPIDKVKPNPFNERRHIEGVSTLVDNIRKRGFWGTLLARNNGKPGFYEIAFGERRLKAAQLAGIKEISLQLAEMSDKEMMENTTLENVNREDVSPLERAQHLAEYKKKEGASNLAIAKLFGLDSTTVDRLMELNSARAEVKEAVKEGKIGWTQALEAQKIGGDKFVETVIKKKLTKDQVRNIDKAVQKFPEKKAALLSGKTHPDDLEIKSLKRSHISHEEMGFRLHKAIGLAGEAVALFKEEKDNFGAMTHNLIVSAIRELKEELKDVKTEQRK